MFGISPSNSHSPASRPGGRALVQRLVCMGAMAVFADCGLCLPCHVRCIGGLRAAAVATRAVGDVGVRQCLGGDGRGGSLRAVPPTAAQALAGSEHCGAALVAGLGVGGHAGLGGGCRLALCGLRASGFARQGLPAAMEGQDVRITAVVAAMPQRTEAGVRLRLQVESADWADAAPDAGRARAPSARARRPRCLR